MNHEESTNCTTRLQGLIKRSRRSGNELLNTKPIIEILRIIYVSSLVDKGDGIGFIDVTMGIRNTHWLDLLLIVDYDDVIGDLVGVLVYFQKEVLSGPSDLSDLRIKSNHGHHMLRMRNFATVFTSLGFVSNHHDSALFVKHSSVGRILLSLCVDDMIITHDYCVGIESLKSELAHRFAIKDLCLLRYFLGMEVATSPKGFIFSLPNYIVGLLDHARITNKIIEDIPIDVRSKYTLTYVHIVTQFEYAPTTIHWAFVLHILMYLRGTQFQTLLFPSTSVLDLHACDSDLSGDSVSRIL
ncbi:uncharacterized mitochondrial protein-like protein [Tanacetum coccineum]